MDTISGLQRVDVSRPHEFGVLSEPENATPTNLPEAVRVVHLQVCFALLPQRESEKRLTMVVNASRRQGLEVGEREGMGGGSPSDKLKS